MIESDRTKKLPLEGVRVADFSRLLPGPWCGQFLSDLGATVVKVEMPETGDMSRHNPPKFGDTSVYFNSVNGGKMGIALDLSMPEGQEIAHRLIEESDVVLESFRSGVAKKLGIDYASAHSLNERIIYCSITGFGQTGPLSHISGHDLVIQSLAGFMSLGTREGEIPQVPGFLAADYSSAAVACIGILSGIIDREKTGKGCNIDLSMFDSLFSMCNIALTGAMARANGSGDDTEMEAWGGNPRYATYATRDGKFVAVALLEHRLWQSFCDVIDRSDLVDGVESPDARHSNHGERAGTYKEAIESYCLSKNRDEIAEQMARHGVPICPIYTPDEALASDLVCGRGLAESVDHPEHGCLPQIANPLAGSGLVRTQRNHAPGLGADARSVLRDLGFEDIDVKRFIDAGVIQR